MNNNPPTQMSKRTHPSLWTGVGLILILSMTFLLGACVMPNLEVEPTTQEAGSEEADSGKADEEAAEADSEETASDETASDETESAEADAAEIVEEGDALEEYKGMPVGFTDDGHPFVGNVDAPVTLIEYSDYGCPFCQRHVMQTQPALNENYVREGQVKYVFRDMPLAQLHPNAPAASVAANCVADQGAAAFWEMHDLLFESQGSWQESSDPNGFFFQLVEGMVDEYGLDTAVYSQCIVTGDKLTKVNESYEAARALGFTGTPSFQFMINESGDTHTLVGAQPINRFAQDIDQLIAGTVPAAPAEQPTAEQPPQLPFWATIEGLTPDPERPGYTMAGDQFHGNEDASVVIIEFSDFQCPFCARHTQDTQPTLDETFVETGQVRWVYKHFPLNIHPQASAAGVAAECAAEQGQFWEMHKLLFADISSWSISDPNPILIGLAEQLALDTDAFTTCLADEAMLQRVQSDLAEGQGIVRGTPTFVIMAGTQGQLVPGALPADRFISVIQEALDGAGSN